MQENANGFDVEACFCDTEKCNSGNSLFVHATSTIFATIFSIFILKCILWIISLWVFKCKNSCQPISLWLLRKFREYESGGLLLISVTLSKEKRDKTRKNYSSKRKFEMYCVIKHLQFYDTALMYRFFYANIFGNRSIILLNSQGWKLGDH